MAQSAVDDARELAKAHKTRSSQLARLSQIKWGRGDALFGLYTGPCVQALVGEKQLRGGSLSAVPRTFSVALCPARNASLALFLPDEWGRSEAAARGVCCCVCCCVWQLCVAVVTGSCVWQLCVAVCGFVYLAMCVAV